MVTADPNNRTERPDHTTALVGNEGAVAKQSNGKQVTRAGATSAEADIDLAPNDLTTGDVTFGPVDVGGVQQLEGGFESTDSNNFEIVIEWLDSNNNVRYTDTLSAAADQQIDDVSIRSDRVQITLSDTSGAAQNNVQGTANFH